MAGVLRGSRRNRRKRRPTTLANTTTKKPDWMRIEEQKEQTNINNDAPINEKWETVADENNVIPSDFHLVLVGNGPSAATCGAGNVINKYRNVVRFNFWSYEGYEEHVGTRCDIWVLNTEMCSNKVQKSCDYLNLMADKGVSPKKFMLKTKKHPNKTLRGVIETRFPSAEIETWENSYRDLLSLGRSGEPTSSGVKIRNVKFPSKPSTGILMVALLLKDNRQINLYGYDFLIGIEGHYNGSKYGACHNLFKERIWLNEYMKTGNVRMVTKED
jgi:hypothetical protein